MTYQLLRQTERFKYCLSNSIIVLPIDTMAKKTPHLDEGLDETSLTIVKSFFPEGKQKTLKELQQRAYYSYEPMHRTASNLVKRGILIERRVGKTMVYTLDMKSWFSKLAFYHYTIDRV